MAVLTSLLGRQNMKILDKNPSICHYAGPDKTKYWLLVQEDSIITRKAIFLHKNSEEQLLSKDVKKEYTLEELMQPEIDTSLGADGNYVTIDNEVYSVTTRAISKDNLLIFDDLSFITWEIAQNSTGFNIYNFHKRYPGHSSDIPYDVIRQFARCVFTAFITNKNASLLDAEWIVHSCYGTVYTNLTFDKETSTSDESHKNQKALQCQCMAIDREIDSSNDSITFKLKLYNEIAQQLPANITLILDVYNGNIDSTKRLVKFTNGISDSITVYNTANPVFSLSFADNSNRQLGVYTLNAI